MNLEVMYVVGVSGALSNHHIALLLIYRKKTLKGFRRPVVPRTFSGTVVFASAGS